MILVGNQRGNSRELAIHLLKEENEHVEVFQVKGFASETLPEALNEAYALSKGTRCRQFLFSLSLNPPASKKVKTAEFMDAIERIEKELGLENQPRAIVFHSKEARRHAHVIWSRIKIEEMKAVQLSFTKRKLQTISRDIYLEHGWKMPHGLANSENSDPRNFTLAEWQQAKRIGKDPRAIKTAFQDAWAISDSKTAFIHALKERGYRLARGDRRGFVAIDYHGEVYSVSKWTGIKTKQVRTRLGSERELSSVAKVKKQIAKDMLLSVERHTDELDTRTQQHNKEFEQRRHALVERQRGERKSLNDKLKNRHAKESRGRQARFRHGLKGIWDRLRGEHSRIQALNKQEARAAGIRDRDEIDLLIFAHLGERKRLHRPLIEILSHHYQQKQELREDTRKYQKMRDERPPDKPRRRIRGLDR